MDGILKKLGNYFKNGKKGDNFRKILLFLGVGAILLIFLSGYIGNGDKKEETVEAASDTVNAGDYVKETEERLKGIVSCIQGAGSTEVMVMVETGTQYVYAKEEKSKSSVTQDSDKTGQSEEKQDQPVILKENDGGNKALVVTELLPRIKGVIVVCEGGGDPRVREDIIQAVKTVLDISGKRVCVMQK